MENIDRLITHVMALEVMVTALAASHQDKQKLLALFDIGAENLMSDLLPAASPEEFVADVQRRIANLRALISA